MKKRGLLVVVSSPSGGGKGTILKELFRRNENLKMSVSATTRAPRPGEEHGVHYYFITKDEFNEHRKPCDARICRILRQLLRHAESAG